MARYNAASSARETDATRVDAPWLSDVYIDSLDNSLMRAYHARPERLYIIRGPRTESRPDLTRCAQIVYQGGEGPFGYSLVDMAAALRRDSGIEMVWSADTQ